jgi:hypothetical protein
MSSQLPKLRRDGSELVIGSRDVDSACNPSTIPRMGRAAAGLVIVMLLAGCEGSSSHPRSGLDQRMFGPAAVRIHPTFTQVRDWTGDKKPDGIEATLEIQDQFGEPTRSTGRAMFELYEYIRNMPGFRGRRIGGPWRFGPTPFSFLIRRWMPIGIMC